jgi:methylphosphotriester-DNA--protein-cysteine methyltransferase
MTGGQAAAGHAARPGQTYTLIGTAVAAGYRPCATCRNDRYRAWKARSAASPRPR